MKKWKVERGVVDWKLESTLNEFDKQGYSVFQIFWTSIQGICVVGKRKSTQELVVDTLAQEADDGN